MSMKILCHAGPWSDKYLKYVIKGLNPNANVIITSAHKKVDETILCEEYYKNIKKNKNKNFNLDSKDNDIIIRCRLLRSIPINKALLHLNSMREAIVSVFDSINPDLVITETIDSYVMDLIYEESLKRKIEFVGLVTVFVNGYVRISARGEYNRIREPLKNEVETVLQMLENKNYLPAFVAESKKKVILSVFFRWLRNLIKPPYFFIKRIVSREYYNYHYWATLIISLNWFHIWPRFNLGMNDWKNRLRNNNNKTVIYIPLQMIPEATVDYWCQSLGVIDYDKVLLKIIDQFSDDFHFLIKEHPNVLGYRNPSLYDSLCKRKNITFCPTTIISNELAPWYDAVLVWTGTVGFESALRGKPVLTLARPYYASGNQFYEITMNTTVDSIKSFIQDRSSELTSNEKYSMVEHLLGGVIPGKLQVDGSWKETNNDDAAMALELGRNIWNFVISKKIGQSISK
mgnify:CR=1 FL=1